MGTIKNILGMSPEVNRSNQGKKIGSGKGSSSERAKSTGKSSSPVKAEISQIGRDFFNLKTESKNYLDEVRNSATISTAEIESIKEKIASNYYFEPEVIDQVVDKLMRMPNFTKYTD